MSVVQVVMSIVAKNPPSILCAIGGIGVLAGAIASNPSLYEGSWILVILGVVLQILYLTYR